MGRKRLTYGQLAMFDSKGFIGYWDGTITEINSIFPEEEKEMKEYDVTLTREIIFKQKVKAPDETTANITALGALNEALFKTSEQMPPGEWEFDIFDINDKFDTKEIPKEKKPLILLCGKSGSGKSTVADILEKKYGLKQLRSYTTRPKRSEDEDGHIFVNNTASLEDWSLICGTNYYCMRDGLNLTKVPIVKKIGGHTYWCTQEQLDEADVYVIDPETAFELAEKVHDMREIHIYWIDADIVSRIHRMSKRGDSETDIRNRLTGEDLWPLKMLEHHDYARVTTVDSSADTAESIAAKIYSDIG